MRLRASVLTLAAALALSATAVSVFAQDAAPLTTIPLQGESLAVSSITYDPASGSLIVGSLAGGVSTVGADGTLTPLVQDDALLAASGVAIDRAANRLYVISSGGFDPANLPDGFDLSQMPQLPEGFDPSQILQGQLPEGFDPSQMPQLPEGFDPMQMLSMVDQSISLLAYDLGTGEQVLNVDLSAVAPEGGSLATGIALDAAGNAYITDGGAGIVYRVDGSGTAAFLSDSRFASEGLALTSIVYHPNGYLLLSKADGSLFKIPLDDPANVGTVAVSGGPTAINSLALLADGRLAALDTQSGGVSVLTSSDDWATASVTDTLSVQGSALTTDGTTLYVLQGVGGGAMLALAGGQAPVIVQIAV